MIKKMEINGSPWNIIKKIAIVFLIVIAAAPGARAISIHDGAGTAGAAFLKIEGGSRPVGMGGPSLDLLMTLTLSFGIQRG